MAKTINKVTEVAQQTSDADSAPSISEWGRLYRDVEGTVAQAWDEAERSIRERVASPIAETISVAAGESQTALARFDTLVREASNDGQYWDCVAEYRMLVEQRVISPLARYLREENPGEVVSGIFQNLSGLLSEKSNGLPSDMEIEEAGQALNRRGGEGPYLLARKAIARVLFSSGKQHPVPVRMLATYHLVVRLPRYFSRKRQETQFGLSLCLTRLEIACSKWTHAVLDLESSLDAASGLVENDEPMPGIGEGEKPQSGASNLPDIDQLVAGVRAAGSELSDALTLAADVLKTIHAPVSPEHLSKVNEFLDYDARAFGTFLLRSADRNIPDEEYLPATLAREHDTTWIKYHEESRNRIRLNQHLLRIRAILVGLATAMTDQVFAATVVPLKDMNSKLAAGITRERAELQSLFDAPDDQAKHVNLANHLREINKMTVEGIERIESEVGGMNSADDVLKGLGSREWERALRDVDQLPAKMDIHAIDLESEARPSIHARRSSVDLKKIAYDVLGLRFADRLRKPAEHFRRELALQWGQVLAIGDVIAFGADAACEVLQNEDGKSSVEDAREFAIDGLNRALERTTDQSIQVPWNEFNDAVVRVVMTVWGHIHQRVRSQELDTDQWAGIGSRLSVVMHTYQLSLRRGWSVEADKFAIWGRFARKKGGSLIRRGQTAVGVSSAASNDGTATINTLHDIGTVRASMPLIYRRLFTFESLSAASFLENRSDDLAVVKSHFDQWANGSRVKALILSAQLGSGMASFINALKTTVFVDADVHSVRFETRHRTAEGACKAIAKGLGLEVSGEMSFDQLELALASMPAGTKPTVCTLYNLEHLVLAVPDGLVAAKELLVFLSRTDHHVYWIGGISELCRQFVGRTATTSGLAQFHALSTFDKESLEAVIMNRHRRSGLGIAFKTPENPSTLMRQRLNRAKSDADRQEIIRNAFFERLSRLADQNIRLAMFYWIRSLRFDPGSDSVVVRWPEQLDFSFLSDLDLQRAFSLRSFLLHQTLTPEEHNEIYRMTDEQGIVILESLLNSGLLTSSPNELDAFDHRIVHGKRYRIHPLLLGPVRQHLVGRHIVY